MKHWAARFVTGVVMAVLMVALAVPAFANETKLNTVVPDKISLRITISGTGKVVVNGEAISRSTTIMVERLETLEIQFWYKNGKTIQVSLNGERLTDQIKDGRLTLQTPGVDSELQVSFLSSENENPKTGDKMLLPRVYLCAGAFVTLVGIIAVFNRRRSVNKKQTEEFQ